MAIQDLYQQLIIDHGRSPRNFGPMPDATCSQSGVNPLCGDKLTLHLKMQGDLVDAASFEGSGCAISVASASLLTEAVKGLTVSEVDVLFEKMHELFTKAGADAQALGKLAVLGGVNAFPTRVKCASLAWHALIAAVHGKNLSVSTE